MLHSCDSSFEFIVKVKVFFKLDKKEKRKPTGSAVVHI